MNTGTMLSLVIALAPVAGCSTGAGSRADAARSQAAPASAATPHSVADPGADVSPIPRPPPGFSLKQDPQVIAAVKERGARTAAADIKAGKLRILVYGASQPSTDAETGFPTFPIPCCDMTGQVSAETDAYNQVMREWHAKHPGAR